MRPLALLLLAACGGAPALTSVGPAGDGCPGDGVAVHTGADDDGDGALDAAEITSTAFVCDGQDGDRGPRGDDGADGDDALIARTPLERGDPVCPFGGSRVDVGLDDGQGGGTAGDGVLQDGEIDDSHHLCDGVAEFSDADLAPPPGPPGTATIDLSGGAGTACAGGSGGRVWLMAGRGVVAVHRTGAADASFELPVVGVDLGDVPLILTSPATVTAVDACEPDPDDFVPGDLLATSCRRMLRVTADDVEVITGLRVEPGVDQLLPPNSGGIARVVFEADVQVLGTLRFGDTSGGVESGGSIVVGAAGAVRAVAPASTVRSILLSADFAVLNEGTLAVTGDGKGSITVTSPRIVNTGPIAVVSGPDEGGLPGGRIRLSGGLVLNRGAFLSAPGLPGLVGGQVRLEGSEEVVNAGAIDVRGGSQGGCTGNCRGGSGGQIELDAPVIVASGALRMTGGDETVADGGHGGGVTFTARDRVEISGDIRATGAPGVSGGWGGGVVVRLVDPPHAARVVLSGYAGLHLEGGAAPDPTARGVPTPVCGVAGGGGRVEVVPECEQERVRVALRTPLWMAGGVGTTGGLGGGLSAFCDDGRPLPLVLLGAVDAPGGRGRQLAGGGGGDLDVRAIDGASLASANVAGGVGGATGGDGGSVLVDVWAGPFATPGDLTVAGGDGDAPGSGGVVWIDATRVDLGGDVDASGLAGGEVWLRSVSPPTVVAGDVDVAGAPHGAITIDGVDVTGVF